MATARDPTNAQGLQAFAAQHGSKLTLVTLDVSDEASIKVHTLESLEVKLLKKPRAGETFISIHVKFCESIIGEIGYRAFHFQAAGEAIKQAFPGGIDVLINNAGISGSYVRSSEQ